MRFEFRLEVFEGRCTSDVLLSPPSFYALVEIPAALGVPRDNRLPKPVRYCLGVTRATEKGSIEEVELLIG